MFRYERPQKGRYREFFQLGLEIINEKGCISDIRILLIIKEIFKKLKIKNFCININYLGGNKTKEKYGIVLREFIEKKEIALC
jgi:histidyl-tRNA synthetase